MTNLFDDGGSFYVLELGELDTNVLRVVVIAAGPVGETRDIEGTGLMGQPISPLADAAPLEVIWPSYLTFLVMDESFDDLSDAPLQRTVLMEHEASPLLDYVISRTPLATESDLALRHWRLVCEDHTIDVIGEDAPIIRSLPREVLETSPREFNSWLRR